MKKLGLMMAATMATTMVGAAAHAENFYFSFSSPASPSDGIVAGTVTGEIFDLTDNATSSASDVEILSAPSTIMGLPGTPFSAKTYAQDLESYISQNSFTVSNGQITSADYQISGGYFDLNVADQYNSLTSPDGSTRVQNLDGMNGATFTAVSAAPEPGVWALMLAGVAMIGLTLRQGRRQRGMAFAA